jgi:predicted Co/Zn/Cd cation transporter (cation efflux family)
MNRRVFSTALVTGAGRLAGLLKASSALIFGGVYHQLFVVPARFFCASSLVEHH